MQPYEIPWFRAAIIEKTKRESDLFHNHIDEKAFIYRYPLIQYKIKDKKPCLVCLKEATEDIYYLLRQNNFSFRVGNKKYDLEIEDVRLRYVNIQTWNENFRYNIHNYIALNSSKYSVYKNISGLAEKVSFLEAILKDHLSTFAEAMDAYMPVELKCKIENINSEKFIEYKGVFHLTFSMNIITNLYIPNYAGLGKGTSVGFGIVKKIGNFESRGTKKKSDKIRMVNG